MPRAQARESFIAKTPGQASGTALRGFCFFIFLFEASQIFQCTSLSQLRTFSLLGFSLSVHSRPNATFYKHGPTSLSLAVKSRGCGPWAHNADRWAAGLEYATLSRICGRGSVSRPLVRVGRRLRHQCRGYQPSDLTHEPARCRLWAVSSRPARLTRNCPSPDCSAGTITDFNSSMKQFFDGISANVEGLSLNKLPGLSKGAGTHPRRSASRRAARLTLLAGVPTSRRRPGPRRRGRARHARRSAVSLV